MIHSQLKQKKLLSSWTVSLTERTNPSTKVIHGFRRRVTYKLTSPVLEPHLETWTGSKIRFFAPTECTVQSVQQKLELLLRSHNWVRIKFVLNICPLKKLLVGHSLNDVIELDKWDTKFFIACTRWRCLKTLGNFWAHAFTSLWRPNFTQASRFKPNLCAHIELGKAKTEVSASTAVSFLVLN